MNSRLDTIQAAVLDVKLAAFSGQELEAVNQVAKMYDERLRDRLCTPVVPAGYYSSWAQYTLRFDSRERRTGTRLAAITLKEKGIPTMIYYPRGMHQQGAFSALPYHGQCPVTEKLCDTVLSLPMHPYLTEDEINVVCKQIIKLT